MTPGEDSLREALASRYRIDRELGAGGMATVYLAQDLHHERPVALKVLRPELAATLGTERFLREIRLAARLQHPHILAVHDSGDDAGQLWFTMPYVEGESLRDRLTREKQLPVDDALRITREAALALEYAHQHGVVHRDIKPENVLLHGGRALVLDFGIALALDAIEHPRHTLPGSMPGTPDYMSPEQAQGESPVDGRSDVYSLACVAYEMICGSPPFTGTPSIVFLRQLSAEPLPLCCRMPNVPHGLSAAVSRALSKVPAHRFATAGAFVTAMRVDCSAQMTRQTA